MMPWDEGMNACLHPGHVTHQRRHCSGAGSTMVGHGRCVSGRRLVQASQALRRGER